MAEYQPLQRELEVPDVHDVGRDDSRVRRASPDVNAELAQLRLNQQEVQRRTSNAQEARRKQAQADGPQPEPEGGLDLEPDAVRTPHRGTPAKIARTRSFLRDGEQTRRSIGDEAHRQPDPITSPTWKERDSYEKMKLVQKQQAVQEKVSAGENAAAQVMKTVGPFAETVQSGGDDDSEAISFGQMRFEENGRVVPYLIIPEHKRDAPEVLDAIVTHMTHCTPLNPDGRPLSKPSIIFDLCSSGGSYMEWAKEAHDNDTLSKAWGWHLWECEECKTKNSNYFNKCERCDRSRPGAPISKNDLDKDETGDSEPPASGSRMSMCTASGPTGAAASSPRTDDDRDYMTLDTLPDEKMKQAEAFRQFVDNLMYVTKTSLACVEESGGWLFSAAGRDGGAQLCGDTIERFRGNLEEVVWMQYAALQDPELFGKANHDEFVQQLRDSAVPLSASGDPPELQSRAYYYSNRAHYSSPADLQSDDAVAMIDAKKRGAMKLGVDISPCATHLLFFDTVGAHREVHSQAHSLDQLPHDHIAALKRAMGAQGVSEGMIMMNGGTQELQRAQDVVSQLNPCIAFKSIGGASDLMARIFQQSQQKDKEDCLYAEMIEENKDIEVAQLEVLECTNHLEALKRKSAKSKQLKPAEKALAAAKDRLWKEKGDLKEVRKALQERKTKVAERQRMRTLIDGIDLDTPYPEEALHVDLRGHCHRYSLPPDTDKAETVVVDAVPRNRNVHTYLQKHMAVMKEKQQDAHERSTLGFRSLEKQLIDSAWSSAAMYDRNAHNQEKLGSRLDFLTNLFNVLIVLTVILKQYLFSACLDVALGTEDAFELEADGGADDLAIVHTIMNVCLIVLPILNGIFITLNSQLDPHTKANALQWADARTESETYRYRCRALEYSASGTACWLKPDADVDGAKADRQTNFLRLGTETYKQRCKEVNTILRSDTTFSSGAMEYHTDEDKVQAERQSRLPHATEKLVMYSEEVDVRHGRPKKLSFRDDGYSRLEATEYLACRTQVQLKRMRMEVQPLSRKLRLLKILMMVATTVSVGLGSINADLFIAISTSAVSFFSTCIEDGDYKRHVHTTNLAITMLEAAESDWTALTFVQKRDPKHKDRLVRQTEAAIMAFYEMKYAHGAQNLSALERGKEGAGGGDGAGGDDVADG